MTFTRAALLALLVATVTTSKSARAQEEPLRVALFKTAADDGTLTDLAAALDPVVSSELSEVATVTISARPALDLPSMQLAIDCVGETAVCLSASAKQADADSLLAPSVTRDGEAVVVTLLHFDPALGAARTVHRRYEGARIGEQALSGVGGMLTELFGDHTPASTRPATPESEAPQPEATQPLAAQPAAAAPARIPVASIVIGSVGVVLIGTGIAFGVMSNSSDAAYLATKPVRTVEDANHAMDKLHAAKTQAIVSNVTIGLGAAAVVGAAVLFYWQLKESQSTSDSSSHVALAPQLAPREVGLTLVGSWSDRL